MTRPKVLLVTKDPRTNKMFTEQLRDCFKDNIEIIQYNSFYHPEDIDLVLTSSLHLIEKGKFPADKIVEARRTIDTSRLAELIKLPKGTKCLVVNNLAEKAWETIEFLGNLGLELEYYPYYPGIEGNWPSLEVAIVPAGVELVPTNIKKIININIRPLDFSTLIEMAVRLKLPLKQFPSYSAKYIREIAALSCELASTMDKMQELDNQIKAIRKKYQAKGFASHYTFQDIVGTSASLKKTMEILRKISKTDKIVLLLGQNGTGKELFAHSIHNLSPRREGPFIPINFAGLPENLAESELFGYEEGSFTGAKKGGKLGFFELANNGTIFLDEIGDASPAIQALLLRVLQERQVMRIGGQQMIPINVRVIAATNKNLQELIEQGKFREDLYFRLAVFPLRIPSLKERKEDIPLLVDFFARKYGGKQLNFSQEVMVKFCDYSWPGNVRELESVIQYLTVVCEDNIVTTKDLPEQFREDGNLVEKISREDSDILSLLEERGDLEDFYFILQALREAQINKETIGRGRIKELLENKGISLSDFKIRHRLNILKNLGLIYSGIRGQGSKINSQGMSVLELLEKERG